MSKLTVEQLEQIALKYDSLADAIEYNNIIVPYPFTVQIELKSEDWDQGEYFWLIQEDSTRKYFVITGSHDYTGWDCQSQANISNSFDSLHQLHLFIPEYDISVRPVRQLMLDAMERKLNAEQIQQEIKEIVNE